MSYLARCSPLANALSATAKVTSKASEGVVYVTTGAGKKAIQVQSVVEVSTHNSLHKQLIGGQVRAVAGISTPSQARYAHTDVQIPDFTAYRHNAVKDSTKQSGVSGDSRKAFSYLMVAGGSVAGAYAGKSLVQEFVSSMSASADVLALAKIEINVSEIPEGKSATFKWRNKPLFVRHRTEDEIEKERAVDITSLRDQQHDDERVQKPEWLILLGVCTHLGCVPINGTGDYGGYYCPCHGSHYDASGRIRKGPAPLNLEIPEYVFTDETTVIVG